MNAGAWRAVCILLAVVLVLVAGGALGPGWLPGITGLCSTLPKPSWPRQKLDATTWKPWREQGRKLGDLVLAGQERERRAAQAQADAQDLAQHDYSAANRLLQERTGGDPAPVAESIIDQELGL
ncbi:hypothetical protein [Pseudomonas protegens]|uniref:hypothetical protein n=1 Tax=Pseudomonas protegens TaxID=380021 RepID=UPI0028BD633A|nr:hypothetical protein [Pseudomonas protegens]